MEEQKKTVTPKDKALKSNKITFIVLEAIGVVCLALGFIIGDLVMYAGILFGATFILCGPYVWGMGKKIQPSFFLFGHYPFPKRLPMRYPFRIDTSIHIVGRKNC